MFVLETDLAERDGAFNADAAMLTFIEDNFPDYNTEDLTELRRDVEGVDRTWTGTREYSVRGITTVRVNSRGKVVMHEDRIVEKGEGLGDVTGSGGMEDFTVKPQPRVGGRSESGLDASASGSGSGADGLLRGDIGGEGGEEGSSDESKTETGLVGAGGVAAGDGGGDGGGGGGGGGGEQRKRGEFDKIVSFAGIDEAGARVVHSNACIRPTGAARVESSACLTP